MSASYPLLLAINKFKKILGIGSSGRVRVLLYHDVSPSQISALQLQLIWLSQRWEFITPDKFTDLLRGREVIDKDYLLLSFDDGFLSNREVADQVLKPLCIKAVFFVITDFIGITDHDTAKKFVANNICPNSDVHEVSKDRYNMSWNDLRWLLEQGHTIGAHTKTHSKLSNVRDADKLHDEISISADMIEQNLNVKIKHFAYPYGDVDSFSFDAMKRASSRFSYVCSGIRGNNQIGDDGCKIVFRDSVTPMNSKFYLGFLLEGGVDFIYRAGRDTLDKWLSNCVR